MKYLNKKHFDKTLLQKHFLKNDKFAIYRLRPEPK